MSDLANAPPPIPILATARFKKDNDWGPRESTPLGTLPPSAVSEDSEDHSDEGVGQTSTDSPMPERPTNPVGRDTLPSTSTHPPAWQNIPGFEELDESWRPAAPSVSATHTSVRTSRDEQPPESPSEGISALFFDARQSSSRNTVLETDREQLDQQARGGEEEGSVEESTVKRPVEGNRGDQADGQTVLSAAAHKAVNPALLPRRIRAARRGIGDVENDSAALTDSEVYSLRAGPSSPSNRKPSHRLRRERTASRSPSPSSAPELSAHPAQSESSFGRSAFLDALPDPASPTRSSTSSEAKQRGGEDPSPPPAALGTPASTRNRTGGLPEETFIEHDVSDLPPVLQPKWKSPEKPIARYGGDIFSPTKLQALFRTPSPVPARSQLSDQPTNKPSQIAASSHTASENFLDEAAEDLQTHRIDESEDMDISSERASSVQVSERGADTSREEDTYVVDKSAAEVESVLGVGPDVSLKNVRSGGQPTTTNVVDKEEEHDQAVTTPAAPPAFSSPPKGTFSFRLPPLSVTAPPAPSVLVATPGRSVAPLRLFDGQQVKSIYESSQFRERVFALAAQIGSPTDPPSKRMRVARPSSGASIIAHDQVPDVADEDLAQFEPSSPLSAIPEADSFPGTLGRKDYVKESAEFMTRMRQHSLGSDEWVNSQGGTFEARLQTRGQKGHHALQAGAPTSNQEKAPPGVISAARPGARHRTGSRLIVARGRVLFPSPSRSRSHRLGSKDRVAVDRLKFGPVQSGRYLPGTGKMEDASASEDGADLTPADDESPQKLLRRFSAAAKAAREDPEVYAPQKEDDARCILTKQDKEVQVQVDGGLAPGGDKQGSGGLGSPKKISRVFATTPQEAGALFRAGRHPSHETAAAVASALRIPSNSTNATDSTARTLVHASTTSIYDKLASMAASGSQPNTFSRSRTSTAPGMLHISPDQIDIADLERLGGGTQRWDQGSQRWVRVKKQRGDTRDIFGRPGEERKGAVRVPIEAAPLEGHPATQEQAENSRRADVFNDASTSSSNPFAGIESFGTTPVPDIVLSEENGDGQTLEGTEVSTRTDAPLYGASPAQQSTPALASRRPTSGTIPRSGSRLRHELVPSSSDTSRTDRSNSPIHMRQATMLGQLRAPLESESDQVTPVTPTRSGGAASDKQPQRSDSAPQPPRSILKGAASVQDFAALAATPPKGKFGTPKQPRSISFADRKTYGRLLDRGPDPNHGTGAEDGNETARNDGDYSGRDLAVLDLLQKLADATLSEPLHLKTRSETVSPPCRAADTSLNGPNSWESTARRSRRGNEDDLDSDISPLHVYNANRPDMTLLTEASFRVTHDKILEYITDVAPWQPDWDHLTDINLSSRRIESVARLKEFLPVLEEAKLDHNQISYLTGLPSSIRTLSIAFNRITSSVSFSHLRDIETLDISNNDIDSLAPLESLTKLRDLRADNNAIDSLYGITHLRSLRSISLRGNLLTDVELKSTAWGKVEALDLGHNELQQISDLSCLGRLKRLDVSHNHLSLVELGPSMRRLRELRVSGNAELASLNVLPVPHLKTLYADFCALQTITYLGHLTHLENFSLRQQLVDGILWPARELRDAKRLYFSGNAFPDGLPTRLLGDGDATERPSMLPPAPETRFFNLVYLELSACQLTSLPEDLPSLAPNMRSLNADHNLFDTLPRLQSMVRLKRLSLVGCRLARSATIVGALRDLSELQVLDVRTNPCTLGLYPPVVVAASSLTAISATKGVNYAHLPPIPDAQLVQPDQVEREARQDNEAAAQEAKAYEMSFFHKRVAPPPMASSEGDAPPMGPMSAPRLYLEADARFSRTLPPAFARQRLLHRGALAMACPALTWLDGLVIDEEEVEQARDAMLAGSNAGENERKRRAPRGQMDGEDDGKEEGNVDDLGTLPRWNARAGPVTPDFARRR